MLHAKTNILSNTILEDSWRKEKMGFVTGLGLIWITGNLLIAVGIGNLAGVIATAIIELFWMGMCMNLLFGGVGFLAANSNSSNDGTPLLKATWSMIRRRSISFALGPIIIQMLFLAVFMLGLFLINGAQSESAGGQIFGAVLIVPTFFVILLAIPVLLSLVMLPCVIGIEDANAFRALNKLMRAIRTNPISITRGLLTSMMTFLPTAILTILVAGGSLILAYGVTNGFSIPPMQSSSFDLATQIRMISVVMIVGAVIAYITVFGANMIAEVYIQHSIETNLEDSATG